MNALPKALALALLAAAPVAGAAETLALLPATGVNVDAGTLAAAQDVLRGQLEMTRKYSVKEVPAPGAALDASPEAAVRLGKEAGADLAVALRIAQLGSTLRARLVAWRVQDGKQVHLDELPAASASELDSVLERLALGLATGRPASSIPPRTTAAPALAPSAYASPPSAAPPPSQPPASPAPAQGGGPSPERRQAASSPGLRIGWAWRQDLPPPHGDGGGTSLGLFALFDIQDLLVDVSLEYIGGGGNTWDLGLGAYWPILPGATTPYVGGGLRYTWLDYGVGWRNGFTPFAAAGVVAGRGWSIQPRFEVAYCYDAFVSQSADGTGYHVNWVSVSLGLGF